MQESSEDDEEELLLNQLSRLRPSLREEMTPLSPVVESAYARRRSRIRSDRVVHAKMIAETIATAMKKAVVPIMILLDLITARMPRPTYSSAHPAVAFIDHSGRMWNFSPDGSLVRR
ncbi:hypothetical protein [Bradyrhizobium sp.]|uniref:hypothetical protein n=1 Tax=Bradyrhizobium sp. TaxID=376 RepID=UPI004037F576